MHWSKKQMLDQNIKTQLKAYLER
ncbi:alkyl hydroperoxide reductase, partial [Acinetobacter baumannii]|nr:alkyl hydroperoxide reductase [Acinetobacter baumannii]MDR5630900.1 alkyl hydroperoxide reductase [Acinetobacter baumannii]MDR5632211.1 alkyl hydroperoxide reductase [Acinetobacter baumannii]MDR5635029.1 alkyl hydroperoxide reductase [Acinetobacter baumannii]MDR5636245.1 alkyl hydroperoxide reductase [Acinetobacter baumannii]